MTLLEMTCFVGLGALMGAGAKNPKKGHKKNPRFIMADVDRDGNCCFRATFVGEVMSLGKNRPSKVMEDFRSRELRVEAMEKLKRQREEYEWATSLSLL